ncbi:hypothetical protein OIU77_014630 [Salix suchowensis]|uniref:Uncharacterized protein n=1 Tax=Salix suchowensis TaxID=1278906 RepID=A0ABQ8ZYV8_9ROSI|nr:hypothetical protein OIU77_014630 [Salix suchowensis]
MLISSLSLSIFNQNEGPEDEERNEVDMGREDELMRTITIGKNIESIGSGDFCFGEKSMGLIKEEGEDQEQGSDGIENFDIEEVKDPGSPLMYLASGLGIDDIDFSGDSGGGGYHSSFPNFEERCDAEEYYKRMIDEYPCHPSLLSSYAGFLQSKGELHKAEEYYHLATLADPTDSKILMQQPLRAAMFLLLMPVFSGKVEDDGEGDTSKPESIQLPSELHIDVEDHAASDARKGGNDEEYYERMIEENPCNSLVLRNYAEFLYQSKRDLKGAEEYYGRAILADPSDGEILSQYAKLAWELHHDHDKASSFFEQAVQATPSDSNVLAAYASFLWETEEIEEDDTSQFQIPNHYEGAAAAVNA